jgi:hypothetical protein
MFELLNSEIVRTSSINRMRGSSGSSELSQQDWHAQAAMMMAMLERGLDSVELAFLYAHYGRELMSGSKARVIADTLVIAVMGSLPTGMHSRRGVEKIVRIFFGQKISMVSVRCDFKSSERTAYEYRTKVFNALSLVGKRADARAQELLENSGVISCQEDFSVGYAQTACTLSAK